MPRVALVAVFCCAAGNRVVHAGEGTAVNPDVSPEEGIDSPARPNRNGNYNWSPSTATNRYGMLVGWENIGPYDDSYMRVARLSVDGTLLDPNGFQSSAPDLSAMSDRNHSVALSGDGENFFAVWRHDNTRISELLAAKISPAGEILARQSLGPMNGNLNEAPAGAFSGRN